MKKYLIISLIFVSSVFSNDLSWVDEQVNAIKPNRVGTTDSSISKIKSPFVYLKKNLPKGAKLKNNNSTTKQDAYISANSYKSSSNSGSKVKKKRYYKPPFKLKMIINSSALIDGKWYKTGDKIKSYKVQKIDKTSVTLIKNKKTYVLNTKSADKLKFK